MMENTVVLYEEVAHITKNMLIAAQAHDWEKLSTLEDECSDYVERLKVFDSEPPLTGEAYARKLASIKSILADDREIRNLVAPWMVKLNAMISTQKVEKRYSASFGA
jgi:flagellar protein FliT